MENLTNLLNTNQTWAKAIQEQNPSFFKTLAQGQSPAILWIGCSDSRVQPSIITQTDLGDLFVHRNIANQVLEDDLSVTSVIQYAVESLGVQHVVVCGHYGCGGVKAALNNEASGPLNNWLDSLQNLAKNKAPELNSCPTEDEKVKKLCDLNVLAQVNALATHEVIKRRWESGNALTLHGLIFDLETGILNSLATQSSPS